MNGNHVLKVIKELVYIIIGNFILAYSVQSLILPNEVLSGGVAGIAVALYPIFHLDKELVINVLVIASFIMGWIALGKEFAIKTVVSSIVYPIFISLLSNIDPLTNNLLLIML